MQFMVFVSHSGTEGGKYPEDSTIKSLKFVVRDFVIGTSTALVATVRVEGTDVKVCCFMKSIFTASSDMPSVHLVSKNVPPLTCYNLDIRSSITIIFGRCVDEKVGNQNILYFPTSPYLCFCTTWANRKPESCVFSLKCCILYTKNTRNTLKYRLVIAKPPFTVKTIDWMHQTGPRILLSVTHMLCVNQICHGVGHCVKDGSCSSSSLSESHWTVLVGYLTISANADAIKHITDDNFSFRKTTHCMQHSPTAAALSTNTTFE